jgi:hypothetical protein
MDTVVGIFQSNAGAEGAIQQLRKSGIGDDRITLLRPGTPDEKAIHYMSDTEAPGIGEALGGTVGGAIGAGGGATLGLAVASLLLPGVGPVLIAGALGAALLGAGGALAGMQAGEALETALGNGLPHDELFLYEDALRQGRSVVIVGVDDEETADKVREVFARTGAESIDAARESWWTGLRDAEALEYERSGGSFKQDETSYRRGFEAAMRGRLRGRSYEDAQSELKEKHQGSSAERPFRAGYERGQAYLNRHIQENTREKYEEYRAAGGA